MPEPMRVGLIGAGYISSTYIRLAGLFRGFRIVALADRLPDVAQARADAFGIEARAVDALLQASDIDLIVNLTVPTEHAEVSARILEAGKHVYSEKPLVLSVEDGRALAELAARNALRIGAAPDTFLGGTHQLARSLLDQGKIGAVTSGTATIMSAGMEQWHPNPDFFFQPGGGPVLDLGPYYIANLVQLLGPVAAVSAMAQTGQTTRTIGSGPRAGEVIRVDTPTTIHALLRFDSGAVVTFNASWDVQHHGHPHMQLYGDAGTLCIPDPNQFGGTLHLFNGPEEQDAPVWNHPLGQPNDQARADYRGIGLADMVNAIEQARPHRCALDFAMHSVDVMTRILTAAASGREELVTSTCARPEPLGPEQARDLLARED